MPTDTTLPGFQATGYRLRRKHEKSRNGCVRCKQQRKKCDELRPSCSRCIKRTYRCHYQDHPSDGSPSEGHESAHFPVPDLPVLPESLSLVVPGTFSPVSLSNNHLSVPGPSSGQQCASVSSPSSEKERLVSNSQPAGILDATELGLLAHYLTHTSQTIPFDDLDLYALSVGVPNLAFNCKAVMSSLLALAAACKSHNIAKRAQPPLDPQNLVEIRELLALAERHHRDSLRHIQVAMQNPDSYDYVLANAVLMVLYASASHSIRVHLAAMAAQCGRRLPNELLPQHSQWISFTRAAHTASTAALNSIVDNVDKTCKPATSSIIDTQSKLPSAGLCSTSVVSPQDGPSESTKRLFLPLVASTYSQAFGRLRARAKSTSALLKRSALSACHYPQLHVSLEMVSVLEKCATAALSPRKGDGKSETPNNQPISFNERSGVSPWVARYMISVTSMGSPQILRRIIMSFLNKAPAEYLTLVQSVLDSRSAETRAVSWITRDSPGMTEGPLPYATHLLAMDIFAHWLVLVMLLDGVWWIGGIGQWELRQVVSLIKTKNLLGQSVDAGETWWPESMYLVKRELTPKV